MKRFYWLYVLIAILIVVAWAPWLSEITVKNLVTDKFNQKWSGVNDGCSLYGVQPKKFLFGYKVNFRYRCGMSPKSSILRNKTIFVSFLNTIHGGEQLLK